LGAAYPPDIQAPNFSYLDPLNFEYELNHVYGPTNYQLGADIGYNKAKLDEIWDVYFLTRDCSSCFMI